MAMKRVLIIAGLLVAVLASVGLILPSGWSVERAIVVDAGPGALYPFVATPKRWTEWTVWTVEQDESLSYQYSGPDSGKGVVQSWTSKSSGSGRLEITTASPKTGVVYELAMDDQKMSARGTILFQHHDDGTLVSWSLMGDVGGNIFARYMGLAMESFVGPDFEAGLAKLETLAEAAPKTKTSTTTAAR